jgi:hypothetical protein
MEKIEVIEYFDDRFYKIKLEKAEIEVFKFMHPDIELTVTDDGTFYYFPSVTTKLSVKNEFMLNRWRGDVGNDVANLRMRLAGVEGTVCHDAWDKLMQGHILEIQDFQQDEWQQIMFFQDMYRAFKPELHARKLIVYDIETLTAGELDWVWRLQAGKYNNGTSKGIELKESGLYIFDGKTSKSLWKKNYYQLGKYADMFNKNSEEQLKGGFIFHSKAQTKVKWKADFVTPEQLQHNCAMFDHLAYIWHDDNPISPKLIDMPSKINLFEEGL